MTMLEQKSRWQELLMDEQQIFGASSRSPAETVESLSQELSSPSQRSVEHELLRKRAAAYFKMGNFSQAVSDLTFALSAMPPDERASCLLARGEARARLGQDETALDDFSESLRLKPDKAAAYARASCHNRLGEFAKAIDDYQTALKLEGTAPTSSSRSASRRSLALGAEQYAAERERELTARLVKQAYGQGVAHRKKGEFMEAIRAYDECLTLEPRHFLSLFDRAFARNAIGDLPGAIKDYTRAIDVDPDHHLARYNRGIAQEKAGDPRGAIRDFDVAIEQSPGSAGCHQNRAYCKRALNDFRGAVDDYEAALRIEPSHFQCLCNKAFCLDALGRTLEASGDYEAALLIRPDHASTHHNLGVVLEKLDRLDEAIDSFDRAVKHSEGNPACCGASLYAKGLILNRLGKFDTAMRSFARATAKQPDCAEYHHALGAALRHAGRHELSIQAFTNAIKANPSHSAALANRAFSFCRLERYDEAVRDYTTILESNSDSRHAVKLHIARAYCLARCGHPDRARDDYEAAIRLDPTGKCCLLFGNHQCFSFTARKYIDEHQHQQHTKIVAQQM